MPLLRVPYTDPLPLGKIIPPVARTTNGAIAALTEFLSASPSPNLISAGNNGGRENNTVLLTGAGISVASGLADYRGTKGTYVLNKTYRPIYFHEFCENHEARKRYWARSFMGFKGLDRAQPNDAHRSVKKLGEMGILRSVITQNVDSFHPLAHPDLSTIELHGYLRSLVCLTCRTEYPRTTFQDQLSALNPAWAAFLAEMLASGALDTENPDERARRGMKTNPDGDVDIPNAPYTTFRYPPCPTCASGQAREGSIPPRIHVDADGAWAPKSTGGVLKPAVIMFGESIPAAVKTAAEEAVDATSRILIIGSSLATYSAWRLVKRAKEQGMPIGIVNIGGVRGEDTFFASIDDANEGRLGVRCNESAGPVLSGVIRMLEARDVTNNANS